MKGWGGSCKGGVGHGGVELYIGILSPYACIYIYV